MHAVLAQLLTIPPPSLTQALPDVAPATNSAIQRALAKRPEDRFATCAEFVTALRNGLASSLALPAMPRPVVPPPAHRIPRWAIIVGLILAALIIGYFVFSGGGRGVG